MAPIAASTMLSGVAKSGSPISRWTMRLPSASSLRARASVSNAPSVPRRDIRSANRNVVLTVRILVDADQRSAVDTKRLACDVSGVAGAQERARGADLRRLTQPLHGRSLLHPRQVAQAAQCVGADRV